MNSSASLAIIGGGSVWTPRLIEELGRNLNGYNLEVRLHGPNHTNLETVVRFSSRFNGKGLLLRITPTLDETLDGVSIVLNQVRIGGWDERKIDETFPLQYGAVGDESLGLGGLRSAIRTMPHAKQLAESVLKLSTNHLQ